tara:strand:- start:163 stop:756 length:594 start_codon:yes stop_codon:yes gene_type:complete
MKILIFMLATIILIGGSYSIGFYNGNDNASTNIDMAINGGKEFMKLYPPGEDAKSKSDSKTSEFTKEEEALLAKVKSGEISRDEIPEDLRKKIRSGLSENNQSFNAMGIMGAMQQNSPNSGMFSDTKNISGQIIKIENNQISLETQKGIVQINFDQSTIIKTNSISDKSKLLTDKTISVSGNNEGSVFKAQEITIND